MYSCLPITRKFCKHIRMFRAIHLSTRKLHGKGISRELTKGNSIAYLDRSLIMFGLQFVTDAFANINTNSMCCYIIDKSNNMYLPQVGQQHSIGSENSDASEWCYSTSKASDCTDKLAPWRCACELKSGIFILVSRIRNRCMSSVRFLRWMPRDVSEGYYLKMLS